MKRTFAVVIFLLAAIWFGGRTSAHDVVEADRVVLHNGEWAYRFATLPGANLTVPAGQTVTAPMSATYDAIEIAGTLVIPAGASIKTTHLLGLPGSVLRLGSPSSPVCTQTEIVIRDVPLDLTRDPFQWGNGIVSFGGVQIIGCERTAFVQAAGDIPQGATSIALASAPSGWQVGDELLIPDTVQQGARNQKPRREAKVFIAAISGATVTPSKPLDFEHNSIRDPDGNVVLRPRVVNLTRDIVIRSENPAGTRGHMALIGPLTEWDIRGVQFVGMGRTTFADLDNTTADLSHIGTNVIGKYALHFHHTGSSLGIRRAIGNSFGGTFGSKWAAVVHGTHDVEVRDNVCTDFQGGCFVTEDGTELRNSFIGNFAAYTIGNGRQAAGNIDRNCPGCTGEAFWFRSIQQTVEGNEAWNNVSGFSLFNRDHLGGGSLVPSVKGGQPDIEITGAYLREATVVSWRDNVSVANTLNGVETWSTRFSLLQGDVTANNGQRQFWSVNSGEQHIRLKDFTAVCNSTGIEGFNSSEAYTFSVHIDGGYVGGCATGFVRGIARADVLLRNVTLQNALNLELGTPGEQALYEHVIHKPLPGRPSQYIQFGMSAWDGVSSTPLNQAARWQMNTGTGTHLIRDWQGTGQDYYLADANQLASRPVWPALNGKNADQFSPERLTVGEAWAKFGIGYLGFSVPDGSAFTPEGLVRGILMPVSAASGVGVPRAVLTFPNALVPAELGTKTLRVNLTLSGDNSAADTLAYISVDGGAEIAIKRHSGYTGTWRRLDIPNIEPGWHTVDTRRRQNGAIVSGSEMTFCYFVGAADGMAATPKPASCGSGGGGGEDPPPTPEICGDGIDNDGDGLIDEGCAPPPPTCPTVPPVLSVTWPGAVLPLTLTGTITVVAANGCLATVGQ